MPVLVVAVRLLEPALGYFGSASVPAVLERDRILPSVGSLLDLSPPR